MHVYDVIHRNNDLLKSPIFFLVTGDWAYVSYMRLYRLDQINKVIHYVILLILSKYGLILILFVTIFLHRVPIWWMTELFLKYSCLNQVNCVLLLTSLECSIFIEYNIWCCNRNVTTFLARNSFLCFNLLRFATIRFALNRMKWTNATEWTTTATCQAKDCSARHSAVGQNDSIFSWKMRMSNFLLLDIEVLL